MTSELPIKIMKIRSERKTAYTTLSVVGDVQTREPKKALLRVLLVKLEFMESLGVVTLSVVFIVARLEYYNTDLQRNTIY